MDGYREERFRYLLRKWTSSATTREETEELFRLLADPSISAEEFLPADLSEGMPDRMRDDVKARMLETLLHSERSRHRKVLVFRYAAAAMVLLSLGIASYLYWKPAPQKQLAVHKQATVPDILPGRERAILTLADGSTIAVDSAHSGLLAKQGGTMIEKTSDGGLQYAPTGKNGIAMRDTLWNTMSTPRGGQYRLQLPDGTKVWLNAASSITFPAAFPRDSRLVKITGEVYFEVAKNSAKPFIVKTPDADLRVLGTAFNVNSYPDEPNMRTSLVEGSLLVGTQKLRPGDVCESNQVHPGDVNLDIAWKDGAFAFANADLHAVMRQLARWYDLKIVYDANVYPGRFTGEIGRDLTLEQLLKGLSITKIKYRLEPGNTLVIY